MIKTKFLGITEFNQNISEYIREVREGETLYYLTYRDKPIAVLIGQDDFNTLVRALETAAKNKLLENEEE